MKIKQLIAVALAVCFALAGLNGAALAQAPKAPAPTKASAAKEMKLKVVGKIAKEKAMGGFYIQGEKPPEAFHITNQNPKVLEKYAKSGKTVTIEATVVMGDNLAIEKIDGKKYPAGMKK